MSRSNAICFLCAAPAATKPLQLKISFTSYSVCRAPHSNKICDRCDWALNLRGFYYNEARKRWVPLFSRNWSWLFQGENLCFPVIGSPRTVDKLTLPTVSDLPTRKLIREWLTSPPTPPFTIAIAQSGKKHVLPWAQQAYSRDNFPIQFELQEVQINRKTFCSLLNLYESLLNGFTKTEINSGLPNSKNLMKNLELWNQVNPSIESYRQSLLLELISYVAIAPQIS